ncbi:MFS transporter [Paraburkholderia caballeronis]|uniref:Predicted arabinose efflux permease, MFS family n=1 Tax=Paraburkholderia caballeronis TaxID=416943 RepID=A0A1H7F1W6_9BURK|nr:MFS transporter [Paraburkholderia caballeronis]PXW23916.1 putative MFS family arabinose efflux permease [Paraburkholderia caballeronis]PXW99680.1 putative MFS family arabinose efflux permease [Paraburkholderia caballeronis]RAJ96634.1 putative MFS family arabinose efflux permease [Paraburkholderia caballeronis]TDV15622.1 putative MFS family arabinose efflux permease [Paraburkholderia caballeronis]TDV17877.1 putative MFS family arabinose efflux permease [Paraburkholderia caballeronis]
MKTLTANEAVQSDGGQSIETRRRNAIKGAFFSEFIDMFDIYLPVVVLSPVLAFFQPPHLSSGMETILASLVFITTLLGRPVGALLFGMIADRVGRRNASIWSVSGFGVVTLLIAVLPGYQSIGIASYWLLVLLRFVDGIFLGGGYTGAMPLAIEYSKKEQRGFVGGFIIAGFPLAYVTINLVAMVMFALFPMSGLNSPYAQWGWRVPFVIGAVLAGILALYYVHKVAESEIWQSEAGDKPAQAEKLPLTDLLRGKSGRNLLQVLVMMTGFWLTQNIITIYLPTGLLVKTLHLTGFQMTLTLMITYCVLFFSYIASGLIAQRIGRRRFFAIVGPLIATVGSVLLYVLATVQGLTLTTIIVLTCVLAVLVTSPWGVIVTYINERFVTDVRATGFGVGFSLSVIIPSFYAFYMNWLGAFMPLQITSVVLLSVGGVIGAVGALMGPETKDVDF